MRPLLVLAVLSAAAFGVYFFVGNGSAPTAEASFHIMRIYGVMGGADGDDFVQFIELREAAGGQNQVQNAQLCFYDADGDPWARFVFPTKVDGAASNDSILIGTSVMASDWHAGGAQPDFIFSSANTTALAVGADVNAPIVVPSGAIVYESTADTNCAGPEQNGAIDWLAYGSGFNGGTIFGTKFATDLPTDGSGYQLKTTPVAFPPTDNSTEYHVVECIVARNNSGQSGTVGTSCAPEETPTPTASPTTAPSPTPTPTASEAPTVTPALSGTFPPSPTPSPTPTPVASGLLWADVDCSNDVGPVDSLKLLRFDAGLSVAQSSPCPVLGVSVGVTVASVPQYLWGDADCSDAVDPVDALKVLRFDAGLSVSQAGGCPDIGSPVLIIN